MHSLGNAELCATSQINWEEDLLMLAKLIDISIQEQDQLVHSAESLKGAEHLMSPTKTTHPFFTQ